MIVMVIIIAVGAVGTIPKSLKKKKLVQLEITGKIETNQTVKIGESSENFPVDVKRFAIIQTPVKYHQVTLV